MDTKQIAKLFDALETARAEFATAESRERSARIALTDACNRLNEAQKAIDAAMAALRKESPRDTSWWNVQHRRAGSSV